MQGKLFKQVWRDEYKAWDCHICVEYKNVKVHLLVITWFPTGLTNDKKVHWEITGLCEESCVTKLVTLPSEVAETIQEYINEKKRL